MTIQVGDELPAQDFPITRADLVRYAGASGDFNPIHWNERFAKSVGLPDVIAHGMFTMAAAIRVVTDWVGDPGSVLEYGVRFTRPVVVPDPDGATLHVAGSVRELRDDGLVEVDLVATVEGQTVLAKARAVVRAAPVGTAPVGTGAVGTGAVGTEAP
jgi:acyl dehydratase